jgi:hypothetical protein
MKRELDSRVSEGIEVRLLWDSEDGRVLVSVADARTGEVLEIDVPDHARALDVFRHPYAYSAGAKPVTPLPA